MRERYQDLNKLISNLEGSGQAKGTVRFPLEVGLGLRRQLRGALDSCKLAYNLNIDWSESKGFLESEFFVKAEGRADELVRFMRTVQGWMDE